MKNQNEKIIYYVDCFAETEQASYKNDRKNCVYLKLNKISRRF